MIPNFQDWNKISLYMVCCYAYYELNESLILDNEFDKLCKNLLEDFDDIILFSNHKHKHFLTKENLQSGTGYGIKDYPLQVISIATNILNEGGKLSWEQPKKQVELKNQRQKKVEKEAKNANYEPSLEDFLS